MNRYGLKNRQQSGDIKLQEQDGIYDETIKNRMKI